MDITLKVKEYIESEIIQDKQFRNLNASDPLLTTGIIDSLGLVKLLSFVNENYSISLDDREIVPENFETIQAISDLIREKIKD